MQLVYTTDEIRKFMREEIELDENNGQLYFSKRLSQTGLQDYPDLLKTAVTNHDIAWLASQLKNKGCIKQMEEQTRNGVVHAKKVPHNAAESMAEGEFNRFYMRGLCRYALNSGVTALEVYRARISSSPRSESEQRVGEKVSPEVLLQDLRENIGANTFLGIPGGVNSGLSVRPVDTPAASTFARVQTK